MNLSSPTVRPAPRVGRLALAALILTLAACGGPDKPGSPAGTQ